MSVKVEKKEHNMATLTIEASAQEFDSALDEAYRKSRSRITVPGFRKGKAPRKMIEKMYGEGVFYEDAANIVIPKAYDEALKEVEETVVSRPKVDVTQIGEGKPFIFTAEVALKPEVTLGQYKDIEVEAQPVTVTDEEVDKELDRQRENNARMIDIKDRPVENGDQIRLDFDGSVDGVPFEGGKAEDYTLTIGSGSFIPGFEDQLIGVSVGETKDVKVTFPENYHQASLAGKEAVFVCKVNAIQKKELPQADDEFAQDVSEFDTLAEYKDDIRRNLIVRKENEARNRKEQEVVEKIVQNAQMDIPDAMVDEQIRRMQDDLVRRVESQGITMEQYLQFTNMDVQTLTDQMRPEALKRIQNTLVLEAVSKAENMEVSEEDIRAEIEKMAKQYNMEADKLEGLLGDYEKEQIKNDLEIQKAVDFVTDAAKEVEKPAAEEVPAEDQKEE